MLIKNQNKNLDKKIQSLEIKSVALRKAADEYNRELEEVKNISTQPTPAIRRNLKVDRMAGFEKDFINGKWSRK